MGKQKNIPHQFPETLLHQIFEHVGGGFVLFTINKDGNLEIFNQFDNGANMTALATNVRHWAETYEAISSNQMFHSIAGDGDEENEEEFLPPPDEEN